MMCFWAFVYEGVQWRGGVGELVGELVGEVVGVVLGLGLEVGVGVGVRDGVSIMEHRRRRRNRKFLIGVRLLSGVCAVVLKAWWGRAWGVDERRMRAGWGVMGISGAVRSVGVSGSGEVEGRGEPVMLVGCWVEMLFCENSVVVFGFGPLCLGFFHNCGIVW